MSLWWFAKTAGIIPNHLLPDQEAEFDRRGITGRDLRLRSMVVRKLRPLPIECVVRGYLAGSGWSSYVEVGNRVRHSAPARPSAGRPAARAHLHARRQRRRRAATTRRLTTPRARPPWAPSSTSRAKAVSLALYRFGHDAAQKAGMILADTKFEFGTDSAGKLVLIDEVLTPDSSRYWPVEQLRARRLPAELRQAVCTGPPPQAFLGPEASGPAASQRM